MRPNRHANADIAAALSNRVRNEPIDSDHREDQGYRAKGAEQGAGGNEATRPTAPAPRPSCGSPPAAGSVTISAPARGRSWPMRQGPARTRTIRFARGQKLGTYTSRIDGTRRAPVPDVLDDSDDLAPLTLKPETLANRVHAGPIPFGGGSVGITDTRAPACVSGSVGKRPRTSRIRMAEK